MTSLYDNNLMLYSLRDVNDVDVGDVKFTNQNKSKAFRDFMENPQDALAPSVSKSVYDETGESIIAPPAVLRTKFDFKTQGISDWLKMSNVAYSHEVNKYNAEDETAFQKEQMALLNRIASNTMPTIDQVERVDGDRNVDEGALNAGGVVIDQGTY